MDAPRAYATADAFRKALEERLRRISQAEQVDINRLRRQVSFDRLLARLFRADPAPWALKGGYALELRLKTARSTIDIDLSLQLIVATTNQAEANRTVRELLQNAVSISLGDWFEYTIGSPVMDLEAAPYGGARYPVEARMAARMFSRFHLDAGIGDAVMEPLETVECREWLEFAGIKGPRVWMIPREQQFAEKLHAYTPPAFCIGWLERTGLQALVHPGNHGEPARFDQERQIHQVLYPTVGPALGSSSTGVTRLRR